MKNTFLKSTFILILSGMATKVLGLIIKVIFTRIVGTSAIGLYSLVMPTYSLLLTICTFSMPTTISKLIAENKKKSILNTALLIILFINLAIIIILLLSAKFIAITLLREPKSYYLLISMGFTLPFASIACILKGYFYGKQKMVPHVISNTIEQIIRLIIVITIIPILMKYSYVHAACGLILTSFFTEFASIVVFLCFMKKYDRFSILEIKFQKDTAKDIAGLSIPSVSSSIIGNICYFCEPIILTNILLYKGFPESYILENYGAYNAYAISTLTIPSFFITAIALALIPEIVKYIQCKNYYYVKKRLKEAFLYTFIIGFCFTFLIFIFRNNILLFLYKTTLGADLIKYLAPFFILFYFEAIFNSFFNAINKNKVSFLITLFSSIIKILSLSILCFYKFGINALLISEIINIIMVVFLDTLYLKRYLKSIQGVILQ